MQVRILPGYILALKYLMYYIYEVSGPSLLIESTDYDKGQLPNT